MSSGQCTVIHLVLYDSVTLSKYPPIEVSAPPGCHLFIYCSSFSEAITVTISYVSIMFLELSCRKYLCYLSLSLPPPLPPPPLIPAECPLNKGEVIPQEQKLFPVKNCKNRPFSQSTGEVKRKGEKCVCTRFFYRVRPIFAIVNIKVRYFM